MSDTFRFCPTCGGALASRLLKAGDPDRLVCEGCGFVFYLDPKVAVGTIIADSDGRIVLVKRAIEPGYGKWVFPGKPGTFKAGSIRAATFSKALVSANTRCRHCGARNSSITCPAPRDDSAGIRFTRRLKPLSPPGRS